jgi:hypothetical protein
LSTADEATGTANGSRKASITFLMKRMGSSDGWGEGGERERERFRSTESAFVRTLSWMEKRSQELLPERGSEKETDTRGDGGKWGEKGEKGEIKSRRNESGRV